MGLRRVSKKWFNENLNMSFKEYITEMPELLRTLESQASRTIDHLAGFPRQGVYVFYEGRAALYVGRSNRLVDRIREHCRESSRNNSATFAFILAKEEMKIEKGLKLKRRELEEAPGFKMAFFEARKRVGDMELRAVEIKDQVKQALFEIYAALELGCKYNDFRTH